MKNNSQNKPDVQDLIKFENELLKLKLQVEFGMEQSNISALSPEVENVWLNNIYAFEEQFKNAKQITVFDALGRPEVKKPDQLSREEIPKALGDLLALMEEKGIALDCCCPYDDQTIYRFITEELFQCEMDDITIKGMVHHFIYEEFHPNHNYDLKQGTEQFIRNLLERAWDPEFNSYSLADMVTLKGKSYQRAAISSIILAFQSGREFEIKKVDILHVNFNVKKKAGKVRGDIEYRACSDHRDHTLRGHYEISFVYDDPSWRVSGFQFPGF